MNIHYPCLVGDIGGTYARFAIEVSPYRYQHLCRLNNQDYANFATAILFYLNKIKMRAAIKHAILAVPSPIVSDVLFMINSPWHLSSIAEIQASTQLDILFINDFHALALAIPHLEDTKLTHLGGTTSSNFRVMAVIGPGTGLGMATLVKYQQQYLALAAEGGRASFSAIDELEIELLLYVQQKFEHVSVERLLSGSGIQLIYEFLCYKSKHKTILLSPAAITALALTGKCNIAYQALHCFCKMLGTIAGNLVCMTNALGGLYIGGGIVPQILDFFCQSGFYQRFIAKGRYSDFLSRVPVYIITQEYPAIYGASYALATYLDHGVIP